MTGRAGAGRPIHTEHGHTGECQRFRRDQAAHAARRADWMPTLIASSEPAIGSLQRHHLTRMIIDDCPRCGWSGYFHTYLVTIDGDWTNTVCDNCYADLHPDITVTVKYYSVRTPRTRQLVAVIRERTRSDHRYPDIGEELCWPLFWEHTTILNEERRDGSSYHPEVISRHDAEHHAASLAIGYWTPEAAHLPWVKHAYPQQTRPDHCTRHSPSSSAPAKS